PPPPLSPLFPYTTLFRSLHDQHSMFGRVWLPDINPPVLVMKVVDFVAGRWVAIWITLAAISGWIRRFLIQYVGDVAVYVAPKTRSEEHTSELQSLAYLVC